MKKIILTFLFASLALGLSSCANLSHKDPPQYSITTPYIFQKLAPIDGPSIQYLASQYKMPPECIEQMTTKALLETYVNYPNTYIIYWNDFYTIGFDALKNYGNFGLAQLMEREDLTDALLEYYIELKIFSEETKDEDSEFFKEERLNVWKLRYLEVLAAQLGLDYDNKTESMLLREMERNYLLYGKTNTFYSGISTYAWTMHQKEIAKQLFPFSTAGYSGYNGHFTPPGTPNRFPNVWENFTRAIEKDTNIIVVACFNFWGEADDNYDTFEEFLEHEYSALEVSLKNEVSIKREDMKTLEVYYSLEHNQLQIRLSDNAKDLLTQKQIKEIEMYFTDPKPDKVTKIFNGAAALCAALYENNDYETNEATDELIGIYSGLNPNYEKNFFEIYKLEIGFALVVLLSAVGFFFFKKRSTSK